MRKRSCSQKYMSRFFTILAVIICCSVFGNDSIAKGESSASIAAKIDSICNQYGFASGKYWSYNQSTGNPNSYAASANKANTASSNWTGGASGWVGYQFSGGSECWAFAGFVGYKLFGQTNPYASWTKYSSADAVRTNGLRAGDIIRTPNHSAVIYSIDSNGIISTVECWGSRWNEIRVHGGFNGWSLTFDQIVSKYGLSYVLHYSGNDSAILWPTQTLADTLEFRDVVYPKTFRIDTTNGWLLQGGTLVSDVNLTSIQSIITRVSDGVVIDNYTKTGLSGKTFAIKSIDTSVKFSKIQTAGNYTWTLLGKDSNNRTVTLVMPFTAVSSGSTVTDKMSMHADAVLVSSIDLKEQETVRVGEKITLTAAVAPDDATYKKLNWESSDTSIATVDENGVVTGVAQGSTTITASATDESGKSAVCEITVKPIADTLEFRDVVYPKTFRINSTNGWFLQGGKLVSDAELTSIQSVITRGSDGAVIDNYTKTGLSGNTFTIKSIDANVDFRKVTAEGKYTWTLIGKDSNGRTVTLEMPFTAVSSGSTVTDTASTPVFIPVSEIVISRQIYFQENADHIGAHAGYRVEVLPSNATNKELTFSIGNELVVSFDDLYQITDPTSAVYGEYYFILRNIGVGSTTLTVSSTDGSNVNATLDFEVVSNITGADVKLQRYIDGELEDIGSFAVEHHRDFFVSSNWYWTFAPGSYEWMFRLDENSGLRLGEGEAGKMNNSGRLIADQTGTYNVYIDFYENGQLVPDGCRTIQVEVVPWLISWINIKQDEVNLAVGSSITLETSMSPKVPTNPNIVWSSSDSDVAAVDETGVVTAIAPGTATITATAADGGGATDDCHITVFCTHENSTWKETKAATCTETGTKELVCDKCDAVIDTETVPINSNAHDWNEWQQTSPTAETRVCKRDSSHTETRPIDAPAITAQLKASATAMQKDGSFTVTLSLTNNPGIGFIVIQSDAAGQGITLEKAEAIGAAAGASVSYGTNATLSSTASISGESGILLLTFKSEAMEEATIQFSCGQCFTVDEDTVSVSGTSVKVAVVKRIPGDATDDGAVDGRDVLRLMKYFAGQSVTFNSSNADVTGDGTVDGRDVLRLMKYFAGQSVILQ